MINLYKNLDSKKLEELEIKKGLVLYHLYCQDYETINNCWQLDEFRNTYIIDLTSICMYILDNYIDNSFEFLQNSYKLIYLICILLLKNNMIENNIIEECFGRLIEEKYQTLDNIDTLIDDISEELKDNGYSFRLIEKEYRNVFNYKL